MTLLKPVLTLVFVILVFAEPTEPDRALFQYFVEDVR
jgi:hypothetical protein